MKVDERYWLIVSKYGYLGSFCCEIATMVVYLGITKSSFTKTLFVTKVSKQPRT